MRHSWHTWWGCAICSLRGHLTGSHSTHMRRFLATGCMFVYISTCLVFLCYCLLWSLLKLGKGAVWEWSIECCAGSAAQLKIAGHEMLINSTMRCAHMRWCKANPSPLHAIPCSHSAGAARRGSLRCGKCALGDPALRPEARKSETHCMGAVIRCEASSIFPSTSDSTVKLKGGPAKLCRCTVLASGRVLQPEAGTALCMGAKQRL